MTTHTPQQQIQDRDPVDIRREWLSSSLTVAMMAKKYKVSIKWLKNAIDKGRLIEYEKMQHTHRLIASAPQMYELLTQVRNYTHEPLPEELQKEINHVLYTINTQAR